MHERKYQAKAMVASSVPKASEIGLDILKQGGNAVDAAIAVAAALTVVEPTSNGIGGDCFALVWHEGHLYGLNASGPAPQTLSRQALLDRGIDAIPAHGWIPVTVPGTVKGWATLHERFGKLSFEHCLQGAIEAAKNGYPVSPTVAKYWARGVEAAFKRFQGNAYQAWFDTFAPNGRAPLSGETVILKDHARTLEIIAKTKGDALYKGELADAIDRAAKTQNAFLTKTDLIAFQAEWVEPIKIAYRGYDVHEIPPNGQGIVALEALGILNELQDGSDEHNLHHRIEAIKVAYSDAFAYVAETSAMPFDPSMLLKNDYLTARRKEIGEQALLPRPGVPQSSGTVYFAVADESGTMVSFIQSNYMGFGSGIVVPHTGIALHNRGHNFSMQAGHPNELKAGKRPYHTIIPGFLTKGGDPVGPFGVMGGFMQPQGHVQVLTALLNDGSSLQDAFDKPRWMWTEGKKLLMEASFEKILVESLRCRGHEITLERDEGSFGRGQAIFLDPETKRYEGATEKRCDGHLSYY